jgi:tRNA pseudouridine55 synthase
MPLIHELPKSYRAQFLLGQRSDTDDLEGNIIETPDVRPVEREELEALLPRFVGQIEQVPPAFSAVHVAGSRAYKLARKGRDVELAARKVTVHRLSLVRYAFYAFPIVELEIECSSGTYIRSIGRDIGEALGCGALMSSLVRTSVGPFGLGNATPFDSVSRETFDQVLLPASAATTHLPRRLCTPEELELVRRGRQIPAESVVDAPSAAPGIETAQVAILAPDQSLAALAEVQPDGMLQPRTVLLEQ